MKSLSRVRLLATPWTAAYQGSSIHGIFQARVLEWVAIAFMYFISVQFISVAQLFPTLCNLMDYLMDSTITSLSLKLMSIESLMPSNHIILCHPLLILPSVLPSIRVFSSESAFCIRCPKYWSFSFSTSPSNKHSWLILFRIDWFGLLAIQRLQSKGLSRVFSRTTVRKHQFFRA